MKKSEGSGSAFPLLLNVLAVVAFVALSCPGNCRADVIWDWILDSESIPDAPPAVRYLGLDAYDADEDFVRECSAAGINVWCYLSIGTAENYRTDYRRLRSLDRRERAAGRPAILGRTYPEWPDEKWLNVRRFRVFAGVMKQRLRLCQSKGFSLVEFDNMDAYSNRTGLRISSRAQSRYVRYLAGVAGKYELGVIHKNAPELISELESLSDVLLFEGCVLNSFCSFAEAFIQTGRPVLNVEYSESYVDAGSEFVSEAICTESRTLGINTIFKNLRLDAQTDRCS